MRTLRAALASACVPGVGCAGCGDITHQPISRGARQNQLIGYGLMVGLNGTGSARYDRNPAWAIKAAGAIQADIKPVADPKAKARAQATDFEAVSSG
jgi:Flagellar P-ring protein